MRPNVLPAILVAALLAACEPSGDQPYVAFDGGGFVFNYRVAEAYYGFNLRPMRRLEEGTLIEVEFENPAGGPVLRDSYKVEGEHLRYSFRTPGLTGIRAGKPYHVKVSVREQGGGKVLGTYEHSFTSDLDQAALPEVPPVLGPGFHLNPAASLSKGN